jgi:hypothetical protein
LPSMPWQRAQCRSNMRLPEGRSGGAALDFGGDLSACDEGRDCGSRKAQDSRNRNICSEKIFDRMQRAVVLALEAAGRLARVRGSVKSSRCFGCPFAQAWLLDKNDQVATTPPVNDETEPQRKGVFEQIPFVKGGRCRRTTVKVRHGMLFSYGKIGYRSERISVEANILD